MDANLVISDRQCCEQDERGGLESKMEPVDNVDGLAIWMFDWMR